VNDAAVDVGDEDVVVTLRLALVGPIGPEECLRSRRRVDARKRVSPRLNANEISANRWFSVRGDSDKPVDRRGRDGGVLGQKET